MFFIHFSAQQVTAAFLEEVVDLDPGLSMLEFEGIDEAVDPVYCLPVKVTKRLGIYCLSDNQGYKGRSLVNKEKSGGKMLLKKLFLRRRLLHTRPPLFKMLDLFKQNIADQVSTISGVERSLVLSAIENPNIPEHGDFAIAIPRLRVKGNPAQLSKDWAAQVFLILSTLTLS